MSKVKPNVTEKRLKEIEAIQDRIRTLADEYKKDFAEPNPLDASIQRDMKAALDSLEFLKSFYKSKTEKE